MNSRAAGFAASLVLHAVMVALFVVAIENTESPENSLASQSSISLQLSQFFIPEPETFESIDQVTRAEPEVERIIPALKQEPEVVPRKESAKPKETKKKKTLKPLPQKPVVTPDPEPDVTESTDLPEVESTPLPVIDTPVTQSESISAPTTLPTAVLVGIEERYKAGIRAAILKNKSYPRQAKRKKQQGTVVLRFRLLPDGEVENLVVKQGSGNKSLDNAAIKAVNKVRKFDAFPDEIRKAFWEFEIPVSFKLR